jgi:hypothetical protein
LQVGGGLRTAGVTTQDVDRDLPGHPCRRPWATPVSTPGVRSSCPTTGRTSPGIPPPSSRPPGSVPLFREIEEAWCQRVGRIRADSATARLIRALPDAPIVTVSGASELIGRSFQQTNEAITRLVAAKVLSQALEHRLPRCRVARTRR